MKYHYTTVKALQYEAKTPLNFIEWDRVGGKQSYTVRVPEVAKALKAILKCAGFTVVSCKSKSYSGGDSIRVEVSEENKHRESELREITYQFEAGSFNGMIDMYEYKRDENSATVTDPSGDTINISAKYIFYSFA